MKNQTKYIIRIFTILLGVGLLFVSLFLFFIEYNELVFIILERAGKLHKIEEFKSSYLSHTKFQLIRFVFIVLTVLFYLMVYKWYKLFERKLISFFVYLITGLRAEISKIAKTEWYLFSIIFALASLVKLYYFFSQPISNDEAFTFLSYVNQGFAASLTYYNLTNNHILHSLLCNVFNLLPVSPVYSLRIASFLVGSITLFFTFILFRTLLKSKAAFIAFVFFAFAPPIIQYGFLARGYSLILLFTVISTFALLKLTESNKNRKKLWFIFIIASALGFYSIPIYLYTFAAHLVFYFSYSLISDKKQFASLLKELVIASFTVGFLVFILYSPIILVSGFHTLIGNDVIKSLAINDFAHEFKLFIFDYYQWIFGGNLLLISLSLVIIPLGLIYSYKKKQNVFLLIVSFLVVPLLLTIIQHSMPYNRLFISVIIFISIAIGLFVESILQKIKTSKLLSDLFLYGFAILLVLIMLVRINTICTTEKQKNNKAYRFADTIENNTTIFSTNQVRYYTFLKFKAVFLDKKQIELFRTDFDKNFAYDYISETKEEDENIALLSKYRYSVVYDDEFIRLYKIENKK